MVTRSWRPVFSLRAKLVLSYLGVALGAMLLLIIVVTLVVQNYFYTTQLDQFRANAEYTAQEIGQNYQAAGGDWEFIPRITLSGPEFYIVAGTNGQLFDISQPGFDISAFQQSIQQALQGQEVAGNLQATSDNNNPLTGFYVSVPIREGGQPTGTIIGAFVAAELLHYPAGFSPYEFLAKVDKAILITGSLTAIVVILFSLWLARRLTRPLTSLTFAAEQMGGGNYTQRVVVPKGNDELGRLAVSFNSMAERIESDVTELHRQDQMRRDLIANIAHDLATPLTAIQGFSEALADDVITDPQARQDTAQLIGREVQRLRRLVSDMQQMTSFESGRIQLDLEPLDLHTLVDEVLEVILPECEQAGITLCNEIDSTTPAVLADSDRMTQVLLNLLDNARRYTPAGGNITIGASINESDAQTWPKQVEVAHARFAQVGLQQGESAQTRYTQASTPSVNDVGTLSATRSGKLPVDGTLSHYGNMEPPKDSRTKWLSVWVKDTGTGIDPTDLPNIFDRFFRSDRARSGASGGSGLGLAIIKAIITAHGGTISAESTPGKGTCITFTLPLA
ncbi:MAG TPA: HAMP domain-containing sensor histidine kinase [Ktedonobacteraceae bacterium]|nr:HAMP domain-containing sensor histidine kinase [Ktedonobacteraceae bacterium]